MSMMRVLGFSTLTCGCAVGHYREVATRREITYIEAKGPACNSPHHRRNHTIAPERRTPTTTFLSADRSF